MLVEPRKENTENKLIPASWPKISANINNATTTRRNNEAIVIFFLFFCCAGPDGFDEIHSPATTTGIRGIAKRTKSSFHFPNSSERYHTGTKASGFDTQTTMQLRLSPKEVEQNKKTVLPNAAIQFVATLLLVYVLFVIKFVLLDFSPVRYIHPV